MCVQGVKEWDDHTFWSFFPLLYTLCLSFLGCRFLLVVGVPSSSFFKFETHSPSFFLTIVGC
jgi:hypothetical protein